MASSSTTVPTLLPLVPHPPSFPPKRRATEEASESAEDAAMDRNPSDFPFPTFGNWQNTNLTQRARKTRELSNVTRGLFRAVFSKKPNENTFNLCSVVPPMKPSFFYEPVRWVCKISSTEFGQQVAYPRGAQTDRTVFPRIEKAMKLQIYSPSRKPQWKSYVGGPIGEGRSAQVYCPQQGRRKHVE